MNAMCGIRTPFQGLVWEGLRNPGRCPPRAMPWANMVCPFGAGNAIDHPSPDQRTDQRQPKAAPWGIIPSHTNPISNSPPCATRITKGATHVSPSTKGAAHASPGQRPGERTDRESRAESPTQSKVEITLPKDANIHASQYQLYLPSKEELQQQLQQAQLELEVRG